MATDPGFIEHVHSRSGLGDALSSRKMFGEYAFYLEGRVVALACDNQLFLKPTDAGRALLGSVDEGAPYPGAKPHFRLDDETDDRALLRRALEATARALPPPKPRPVRPASGARKATRRGA